MTTFLILLLIIGIAGLVGIGAGFLADHSLHYREMDE